MQQANFANNQSLQFVQMDCTTMMLLVTVYLVI